MNLETKVECKRLEAASVSSFSTKIVQGMADIAAEIAHQSPVANNASIHWRALIVRGFVVKELQGKHLNIV